MCPFFPSLSYPPCISLTCLPVHNFPPLPARLVNPLSSRLHSSTTTSLYPLKFAPFLRRLSECTSGINSLLVFFLKGRLLCTNTVQTRLPSVLSPFESACSLNTTRLKRMPSAFLLQSLRHALRIFLLHTLNFLQPRLHTYSDSYTNYTKLNTRAHLVHRIPSV